MTKFPISQTDRELRGLRGAVKVVNQQLFHHQAPYSQPLSQPPVWKTEFTFDGRQVGVKNEIPFSFDGGGRKTRVRTSRAEDYRPNTSAGGSPFSIADRRPNLPGGGTTTTYYDEQDRPVVAEVRDAQGGFVMRAERLYDKDGRIAEEKLSMLDPAAFFPGDLYSRIPLGKRSILAPGDRTVKFTYDSENCAVRAETREPGRDEVVVTSYNAHCDPEIEIVTRDLAEPNLGEAYYEVRYAYQYDQTGNWTEKAAERRLSSEGPWEPTVTIRRTLEYF